MSNLSEHLEGQFGRGEGTIRDRADSSTGKLILEIGPGPGALTRSLLTRQTAGVLGVEIDPRFNSYLEQIHQQTNGKFHWANADIMTSDEYALIKDHFPELVARWEGADSPQNVERTAANGEYDEEEFDGTKASASPRGDGNSSLRNGFHTPLRSLKRESILKRRQHLAFGSGVNARKATSKGRIDEEVEDANDFFRDDDESTIKQKTQKDRKDLSESEKIIARWASAAGSSLVVVSNLPFSLATNLLMRYSFDCYNKSGIYKFGRTPVYCLLQLEVANRLIALPPGTRVAHRKSKAAGKDSKVNDEKVLSMAYGRPSVLFQNYFHIRVHRLFSEKTFFPRTDVLGAFVQLTPRATPLVDIDPATLIAFLNTTFLGRLRGRGVGAALRQAMPAELASYALQQLRLDSAIPIGQLTVREVALLAKVWERYMLGTNQSMHEASEKARAADRQTKREEDNSKEPSADAEVNNEPAGKTAPEENPISNVNNSYAQSVPEQPSAVASDDEDETIRMMFSHLDLDIDRHSLPQSDAERFAAAATALDGDAEVIRQEGSIGHLSREDGGQPSVTYGINPREAFVNDAMEFFGLSDTINGSERHTDSSLGDVLKNAKNEGKNEYLKFKEQMRDEQ